MSEINIKDIAKIAGVSYASVSRAINGKPGISETTRKHILDICAKEGYRQNSIARGMVLKKTNIIGLFVPDISNPFYSEITLKLDNFSRKAGYNIMLCNTHGDDKQTADLYHLLTQYKPDGLIFVAPKENAYPIFSHSSCPVIYVGDTDGKYQGDFVSTDNSYGGYQGFKYLYDLGHRDIIYFGWHPNSSAHSHRWNGFKAAAADYNIVPQRFDSEFSFSSIENGYTMAKQFFSQNYKFTAIFAASDTLALGIIKAADELGLQIPKDFSLLGFDNISTSGLPRIMLTTIEQPTATIAEAVIDLIIKRLKSPENATYTHQTFRPKLIKRLSCDKI